MVGIWLFVNRNRVRTPALQPLVLRIFKSFKTVANEIDKREGAHCLSESKVDRTYLIGCEADGKIPPFT